MAWERYNFTDDFQEAIIACLIKHPEEFMAYGDIVKAEFFNGVSTFKLVSSLEEYQQEYGGWPKTFTVLANYAHDKLVRKNPQEAEEVLTLSRRIATLDTDDWKAVRDRALNFAKERAALQAVKKIHWHITEGKTDQIDPIKELEDALAVGRNRSDQGIILYDDYEKVIRKLYENSEFGVQTGFPMLDTVWKTGWQPGWLVTILAPPKGYKTTFCLNLALSIVNMRSNDGDVLYYSCEMQQEQTTLRLICNLNGLTGDDAFNNLEKFIQKTGAAIKQKMRHHIYVRDFSSKMPTIGDIRADARFVKEQRGLNPRVIVIDYAENIKPAKMEKDRPDYRTSADVYTEARAMGAELGCVVIMPDRCNKETVQKKVPSKGAIQGSFQKEGILDIGIALCATNAELLQNRIRYFVFYNRYGGAPLHFGGKLDRERYRMTIDEVLDYDESMEENDKQRNQRNKSGKGGEKIPPSLGALMRQEEGR
jgi:replicative DNA helicase